MDKRRILVVEDERPVAKHIENMVRGLGYDVTAVFDNCVRCFREKNFSCE
jgi:CheY-like chemotaxis protein